MSRIFSNGPNKDFVINPFSQLIEGSSRMHLAAPYFTQAEPLLKAAQRGKTIQLLIGLNVATSPQALRKIHEIPGIAIRYLTSRFHAKIFIFDKAALLGSSNLTDGGLRANREAVIRLDREEDADELEDIRALFVELWDAGQVLTSEKLALFEKAHTGLRRRTPDSEKEIEAALGQAQPLNINVASHEKSSERVFLETLRQEVYEQYRPAFSEVTAILDEHDFRRPDLADVGIANETNRFLNYVRLTHVIGDEAWQTAPLRSPDERRKEIMQYAQEWVTAANNKVPEDYASWLRTVKQAFGTREAIKAADKEQITQGLMSLHAFTEQLRFVKGGLKNLPAEFWKANDEDVDRVRTTLTYLLHGPGDFIQRFHDVLYDLSVKPKRFGYFCALELYGTINPEECPPMNGRMAKAMRFLGFDVKGA
ncbi:phospholipase D family protein [uncultured Ruegeria sp.]|uniref:phospholipase D family protein n=1 Tax=uncultured Ruegeria sp. TaxID=259304 RepID=UPI002628E2E9|nr:phospholipase D family protein [uncultured Ruegeria sp.]